MVSLSLLVICAFSKTLAFHTKASTEVKKHDISGLKPNLTELVEALNTSQKIWLKMLSYSRESVTCLYFEKIELTKDSYLFNERYLKQEQRKKIFFSATLSEGPDGPVMDVTFGASKAGCEQYVWDSRVKKNVKHCDKAYKRICGKMRYIVYKRTCRT
ncbi:uncharacterized protein LOC119405337 isoform X2 [Rhipicephalus sanguineus]|uniref:uncharacterized protein LOC119405337 isoform X2 n=1 Tax=Rhipicephalus sanguineus TaxID=34632 RepID=UPI0020C26A8F|nr:uncharacterized protein LOC119405337 isoform X2 [Rhipicephalus sanguineus]